MLLYVHRVYYQIIKNQLPPILKGRVIIYHFLNYFWLHVKTSSLVWELRLEVYFPKLQTYYNLKHLAQDGGVDLPGEPPAHWWLGLCVARTQGSSCFWNTISSQHVNKNGLCLEQLKSNQEMKLIPDPV